MAIPVQFPADSGLYSLLSFREDGQINLDKYRMLLLHSETMGVLRKELIESLGVERARCLLTRMGYESGKSDAHLVRRLNPDVSDMEAFSMGPQLHSLEGIVQVKPLHVDMDLKTGEFYGELLWENSYEAQTHIKHFGIAQDPVCWMQIGYASGYTSTFMDSFVLYKELECSGCGEKHCRIMGKTLAAWGDDDDEYRYFKHENLVEQILNLQEKVDNLRFSIDGVFELNNVIGKSACLKEAFKLLENVAESQATVMFLGETGVGKDLFASTLHDISNRRKGPFVPVNCAAIPEELIESELFGVEKGAYTGAQKSRPGKFERAHNGTLFLDEVDKLSESAQSKLLRVLQNNEIERVGDTRFRKVDVRIVTACNSNLEDEVKQGHFRKDLYFRLCVYPIQIPPLRDRGDDIPELASHFISKFSARYGKSGIALSEEAMHALLNYSWPGNIREFENVIERGVILCANNESIKLSKLLFSSMGSETDNPIGSITAEIIDKSTEFPRIEDVETILIKKAVQKSNGNLSAAAKLLDITRPQLAYRLKKINKE